MECKRKRVEIKSIKRILSAPFLLAKAPLNQFDSERGAALKRYRTKAYLTNNNTIF